VHEHVDVDGLAVAHRERDREPGRFVRRREDPLLAARVVDSVFDVLVRL
jgi:hypothetical protein